MLYTCSSITKHLTKMEFISYLNEEKLFHNLNYQVITISFSFICVVFIPVLQGKDWNRTLIKPIQILSLKTEICVVVVNLFWLHPWPMTISCCLIHTWPMVICCCWCYGHLGWLHPWSMTIFCCWGQSVLIASQATWSCGGQSTCNDLEHFPLCGQSVLITSQAFSCCWCCGQSIFVMTLTNSSLVTTNSLQRSIATANRIARVCLHIMWSCFISTEYL